MKKYVIEEIEVNDIVWKENFRSESDTDDVSNIMHSVQYGQGLYQHIAVNIRNGSKLGIFGYRRCNSFKKLGLKTIPARIYNNLTDAEMIIMNINENTQRKNIGVAELAMSVQRLKEENYTLKEIQEVLSLPKSRLRGAVRIQKEFPPELLKRIIFIEKQTTHRPPGSIPYSFAKKIIAILRRDVGISKQQHMYELVDWVCKDESSLSKLRIVGLLYNRGFTIKEALNRIHKIEVTTVNIPYYKNHKNSMKNLKKKYDMNNQQMVCAMLAGDVKDRLAIPKPRKRKIK